MSGLLLCLLFSNYLWLLNSANSQLKTSSNKHTALWKTALTAVICTCIQLLVLLSVILLPFRLWCSSWYSMDSVFWGYFPVKLQPVYVVLWCGTQSRKGYLQGLLTRTVSWVFFRFLFKVLREFVSKSWDFWACHHLELEIEVLGRFLWFLCLKSHCDRKLYSQRGTQMRWMRQKCLHYPTLYISYCFGCSKFFLGKK